MIDETYMMRLESTCEALRIRNGELVVALMEANPDSNILTKPVGYTRTSRLNRVVEAALEYCNSGDDTGLREAVEHYNGYWSNHYQDVAERRLRGKRAQENKSVVS
jgi:hypothetical protein